MSESIYDRISAKRKKLQAEGLVPEWYTTAALQMFDEKYEYQTNGRSVKGQFERIAKTAAKHVKDELPEAEGKFFELLWNGWLSPSTPVFANMGTNRGMPVSCSGGIVPDSIDGFYKHQHELAQLTKYGFGTSSDLSGIRPRGSSISVGGESSGALPVYKMYVETMRNVAQGCYTEGTQVLTDTGFVDFKDISINTNIAQVDQYGKMSFSKGEPTVRDWDGDIYSFSSPVGMNLSVTPNHRMMVERIKQKTTNGKRTKYWGNLEEVQAKDVKYHRDVQHRVSSIGSSKRDLTCFEKFYIAYQADGKKHGVRDNNGEFRVYFRFKKERKINRLIEILNSCGFEYTTTYSEKSKITSFSVKITDKHYFPTFSWVDLNEINGETGKQFLNEVAEWDSYKELNKQSFTYSSVIKENADVILAVASVSNARCRIQKIKRDEKRKEIYRVYVSLVAKPVQGESITTSITKYSGKVYCCIVPEGRILVKDSNGFVSVCGNTSRRGAWAGYLDIEHGDFDEVWNAVNNDPDDSNIGWVIRQSFVDKLNSGDKEALRRYKRVLKLKMVQGKGYFCFIDKINSKRPAAYVNNDLYVKASNLCNEITLFSDAEHTFTCVLSSMNVYKWDEWKDTDAVFWATVFLDCVASEFIEKAQGISGLEKAVDFTIKGRALGLGQCGWHSLLQKKRYSFGGLEAQMLSMDIAKHIFEKSKDASRYLAHLYGEPEWCKGTSLRNTHRIAIAPTKSTALLMGGISEGINPDPGMVYSQNTSAGVVDRIVPEFLKLMKDRGHYSPKVIKSIVENQGSVQHIDWLTAEEKLVFRTAFEINQKDILRQATTRGRYLDQWQSLNLFFGADEDEEWISEVHQEAFENPDCLGLYYIYTKAGVQGAKECEACM